MMGTLSNVVETGKSPSEAVREAGVDGKVEEAEVDELDENNDVVLDRLELFWPKDVMDSLDGLLIEIKDGSRTAGEVDLDCEVPEEMRYG